MPYMTYVTIVLAVPSRERSERRVCAELRGSLPEAERCAERGVVERATALLERERGES